MTFEEWLDRIPAGPEPEAPCFQWSRERVGADKKAISGIYPFGILYPLADRVIGESSCCEAWERLYNLQLMLCPQQSLSGGEGDYFAEDELKIDQFIQQLKIISDKKYKQKFPTTEGIDAVDGIIDNYQFISFTHESTPQPKTWDVELLGLVTTLRFSLIWRQCH